jgi:hypothetical protein
MLALAEQYGPILCRKTFLRLFRSQFIGLSRAHIWQYACPAQSQHAHSQQKTTPKIHWINLSKTKTERANAFLASISQGYTENIVQDQQLESFF